MESSIHPHQVPLSADVTPASVLHGVSLSERIATLFERVPVGKGAEFVPDLLKSMGHERLVAGMYDISSQLQALGYSVDVEYFARPQSALPPLITLTVRGSEDEYLYPNTNLRMNPAIPRERFSGDGTTKYTVTSEDQELGIDQKYLPPLKVERFSPRAEVRILLKESDNADMPYQIEPLFSPAAFVEARAHAAEACRGEGNTYSVIFHEQILSEVATRLHQESELFGIREIPEIQDLGSDRQGHIIRLKSWVPHSDGSSPIALGYAIEQDSLHAAIRPITI